ncbi:MAG: ribosome small subunit-dependent GTPase A [Myxococcota bacterium]
MSSERIAATVVEVHGIKATALVHSDGRRLRCRPLRDRRRLAVGDRVEVEATRHGPRIVSLEERERCLWRPVERGRRLMAAHVDRVVVVGAVAPEPRPGFFDRFLVAADAQDIDVVLVLNKVDREEGLGHARRLVQPYRDLDYPVLETSAHTGEGVEALEDLAAHGLTVLAGHSGVGKSSLLNRLVPDADLRVAEVSDATGRGRHTTSVTTCHRIGAPWPEGGLLVDTPGVRSFGLYGMDLVDLSHGFRDLRPFRHLCRFRDCVHETEPGCAVREAVEEGRIARSRYESYLRILRSVRSGEG